MAESLTALVLQVERFLDQAEAAEVRHVTLLSTFNGPEAPREIDNAASWKPGEHQ